MTAPFVFSPSQQEHNAYAGGLGVESGHMRQICTVAVAYLRSHYGYPALMVPDFTAKDEPADFQAAVAWSNKQHPRGHLAVHSNAGGTRKGTDTYYASDAGRGLAEAVQKTVALVSPGPDGGTHHMAAHWAELYDTEAPAALIEIEFHDYKAGALSITDHYEMYGRALADGVAAWLGIRATALSPELMALRRRIIAVHAQAQSLPGGELETYQRYAARWATKGG